MRDLNKVAKQCMEELASINIGDGFENVLEIKVNTRAKKRWGQCRRVRGFYYININADLLDESTDLSGLKSTIIHELLHTLPGCLNHGATWNSYASKVNRELGYNIKRCSSDEEKGLSAEMIKKRTNDELVRKVSSIKYIVVCNSCGNKNFYQKRAKVIDYPQLYRCGRCRGKLSVQMAEVNWEAVAERLAS